MSEDTFILTFGYKKLIETRKIEGSKIYMGGYAIQYDQYGIETNRTANEWSCVVECHTAKEAQRLLR